MLEPGLTKSLIGLATVSTDNAVVKFSGTTGNTQNSGVIVDASNNVTGVAALTASGTVQGLHIRAKGDQTDYNNGQLRVHGATDDNKRLSLGFQTTANLGFIQAVIAGSDVFPLALQPNGSRVLIGTATDDGATRLQVNGAGKFTGGPIAINTGTPQDRLFAIQTANVSRWAHGGTAHAEGGANTGTKWALYAYSDAGAYLDTPIEIDRAAGGTIALGRPISIAGQLAPSTDNARTLGTAALQWSDVRSVLGAFTGALSVAGIATVSNATASTTTTTGALVASGGVGIGGALNAGSNSVSHKLFSGGSATSASVAGLEIGSSGAATAGNIYGLAINKSGTTALFVGVNKNSATGSVPSNAGFISTYGSGDTLVLGRGNDAGLPNTADLTLASTGASFAAALTVGTTIRTGVYTVASLPAAGTAGRQAFASNGRKNGEGAGLGTGVLVFDDATAWRACDTGATVAA